MSQNPTSQQLADHLAGKKRRKPRVNDSEAYVVRKCLQYLIIRGIFAWRQNTGAAKIGGRYVRFGIKGQPDILGIMPDGRFLGIECKRPSGGKQSESQKWFQSQILANNGVYLLVRSVAGLQKGLAQA